MVVDKAADTNTAVNVNPDKIVIIDKIFDASQTGYKSPYPTVKNVITTKYKASPQEVNSRL
jgi:hypothetical protein